MDPVRLAPLKEIEEGVTSVAVPPPQSEAEAFGTVRPAGSVRVNPTPVSVEAFGLWTRNVNAVVLPRLIGLGLNDAEIVGGNTALMTIDAVAEGNTASDLREPV